MKRGRRNRIVPLVVCEEHHEAFYVWHHAIRHGWIPAGKNALLHFDEHADTALPRLGRRPPDSADLAELAAWVYRELRIDDFIVPALHQGVFDRFEWFRQRHAAGAIRRAQVFTATVRGEGRSFLYGQWLPHIRRQPPADARLARYRAGTIDEAPRRRSNVVLDFDLDYFLCQPRPVFVDRRIYLSPEEYARLTGNRYHFLFTAPGAHVGAGIEDGRPYLEFGAAEPAAEEGPGDPAAALRRVDEVIAFLAAQTWQPRLIVTARSRHSGYTPAAHWQVLEDALVAGLQRLYPVERKSIDELLPTEVRP